MKKFVQLKIRTIGGRVLLMILLIELSGCAGSGIRGEVVELFLKNGGVMLGQPVSGLVLRQGDAGFIVIGGAAIGGFGGIYPNRGQAGGGGN